MEFDIHIPNPTYVPAYQNKIEFEYGSGLIAAFLDIQVVGQKAAVLYLIIFSSFLVFFLKYYK